MKTILGALAAITVLGAVAISQPAEAACWATPYGWHCSHPRSHFWYGHHHHHRYYDHDWR